MFRSAEYPVGLWFVGMRGVCIFFSLKAALGSVYSFDIQESLTAQFLSFCPPGPTWEFFPIKGQEVIQLQGQEEM